MKRLLLLSSVLFFSTSLNAQIEGACEVISVTPYCDNNQLCLTVEGYTEEIQNQSLVFEYENGDMLGFPIDNTGFFNVSICGHPEQSNINIYISDLLTGIQCSSITPYLSPSCSTLDNDGDGVTADVDCDDQDANTYPGAPEICDSKDNNCDGNTDEGLPTITYYWDADLDGYGNPNLVAPDRCSHPGGRYVEIAGDCDDNNASVNPGATEILDNGIDDDCNPDTPDMSDCLIDSDNDGTPDCEDGCPNDRKKTEPGDCGCGVVDRDRDNDGVADCNDVCDREDDTIDTDADGIPDCIDDCPNDPSNQCTPNPCGIGETLICHYKNNGDTVEMCLSGNQLQRHLDHGDTIGGCTTQARQANSLEDVAIFPNPSKGKFSITLPSKTNSIEYLTISIKNSYGIEVFKSKLKYSKTIELDMRDYLKDMGMYFIFISDGNKTISKKIIITK